MRGPFGAIMLHTWTTEPADAVTGRISTVADPSPATLFLLSATSVCPFADIPSTDPSFKRACERGNERGGGVHFKREKSMFWTGYRAHTIYASTGQRAAA